MSVTPPSSQWKQEFWQQLYNAIFESNSEGQPKLASQIFLTEDPLSNFANFAAYIFNYYKENVPANVLQEYAEFTLSQLIDRPEAKHLLKTTTIPHTIVSTAESKKLSSTLDLTQKPLPSAVNWVGFYYLREYEVDTDYDSEGKYAFLRESNENTDLLNKSMLFLGPFCGKPAVSAIPIGKGVCGESINSTVDNFKEYRHYCVARACGRMHPAGVYARTLTNLSSIVPNVHDHPNHLACDAASNSEIVIPLVITPPIWNEHPKLATKYNLPQSLDQQDDGENQVDLATKTAMRNNITQMLLGLLDIDSPYIGMFDETDAIALSNALWLLLTQSEGSHHAIKQKHVGYAKLLTFLDTKDDLVCKAHD